MRSSRCCCACDGCVSRHRRNPLARRMELVPARCDLSSSLLTSALPAGIAYPRKVLAVEDSTYDWWKLASTPCAMRPPECEFPTPLAFRHQGCPTTADQRTVRASRDG